MFWLQLQSAARYGEEGMAAGGDAMGNTAASHSFPGKQREVNASVWDPRLWDRTTHREGLPPQSTQCRKHLTNVRKMSVEGGESRLSLTSKWWEQPHWPERLVHPSHCLKQENIPRGD